MGVWVLGLQELPLLGSPGRGLSPGRREVRTVIPLPATRGKCDGEMGAEMMGSFEQHPQGGIKPEYRARIES